MYVYLQHFEKAEADFTRCMELGVVSSVDLFFNRGIVRLMMKKYKESITDFEFVLEIEPGHKEAKIRHQQARNDLRKAIIGQSSKELKIEDVEKRYELCALFERGIVYMWQGKYNLALNDFEDAKKLAPNVSKCYLRAGTANKALGRLDEALRNFDRAIELGEETIYAKLQRGQCFDLLGREEEAKKELEEVLGEEPSNCFALCAYGGLLHRKFNNKMKALECYEKSIEIDPYNAEGWVGRGVLMFERKEYRKAVDDFSNALKIRQVNAHETLALRGSSFFYLNEYEKAIQDFTKVIELSPKNHMAYLCRSAAFNKFGEIEKGQEDFQRGMSLKEEIKHGNEHQEVDLKKLNTMYQDINDVGRFAFLVGQNQGELKGCQHDTIRMKKKLEGIGYECHRISDVACTEFMEELEKFIENFESCGKMNKNVKVFFYFSGHGLEINSEAYLCCFLRNPEDKHIRLVDVLERLNKVMIKCEFNVVLDCCRYRPPELQREGESFDSYKCFASTTIRVMKYRNNFVLGFSCGSGKKSDGGAGDADLSIFTNELLLSMRKEKPFLFILYEAGKRMKSLNKVHKGDEGRQISCVYFDQLRADIFSSFL